jgi:hypothetical protein
MANEARKWYENTHHELLGDDGLLHGLHYSHSEFAGTEPQPPNKNRLARTICLAVTAPLDISPL